MSNAADPYTHHGVPQFREAVGNAFLPEKEKSEKGDRSRLRNILRKFCDNTSMHGCGQISGAKMTTVRILWIILTVGAVSMLMFHLYSIFYTYFKWPIQTKVSLGFNNLQYPAITLCNVNILKKSSLEKAKGPGMVRLRRLVNSVSPDTLLKSLNEQGYDDDDVSGFDANLNITNSTASKGFSSLYSSINLTEYDEDLHSTEVNETADDDWNTEKDSRYLMEEVFETAYLNIHRKTRTAAGHDISEMLISCAFNGYSCYADNFTLYQTSSFGNCWTLTSPRLVAKSTGPKSGLSMVLFLQTNEFLEGLTDGYGVKLVVHYPGTKPLPQDEGLFIPAASETNIGLVQKTIIRLGGKYGDCNDGVEFKNSLGFHYSRQACQAVCKIREGLDTCGCYGSYYEEMALAIDKDAKICNSTRDRRCLNKVTRELQQKSKVCVCDNPCREVVYELSVSSRQWPTENYANLLLEGVCETDPDNCLNLRGRAKDSRHVANNFIKLNIFYETLNFETIEEEPLIDVFQFLASIGGALGLWIGLSMLSVCEILQLAGKVFKYFIERCRHSAHHNRVKS